MQGLLETIYGDTNTVATKMSIVDTNLQDAAVLMNMHRTQLAKTAGATGGITRCNVRYDLN